MKMMIWVIMFVFRFELDFSQLEIRKVENWDVEISTENVRKDLCSVMWGQARVPSPSAYTILC